MAEQVHNLGVGHPIQLVDELRTPKSHRDRALAPRQECFDTGFVGELDVDGGVQSNRVVVVEQVRNETQRTEAGGAQGSHKSQGAALVAAERGRPAIRPRDVIGGRPETIRTDRGIVMLLTELGLPSRTHAGTFTIHRIWVLSTRGISWQGSVQTAPWDRQRTGRCGVLGNRNDAVDWSDRLIGVQ